MSSAGEDGRSDMRILRGRCECRAVAYEVEDDFLYALNCHCSNCRASTGAAFKPFAGVARDKLVVTTFVISGALAGLAGVIEIAGPVGHLQPAFSPGYGFTAIIVAFLGRLHPVGILFAALFLALTVIGGEGAQITLKVPLDLTKVFQGLLLFYVLACDSLVLYRIRVVMPQRKTADGVA